MDKLKKLLECGQSYWLDNLTREMLDNGELERRVETAGLRGMTSNPKTFSKAISSGTAYDEELRELAERRIPLESVYEKLAVADVRRACDVFRSVHEASNGVDGFVSLEVSPYLAHDSAGTMVEARRLFAAVDRPNVFIKIPGTVAGLDAIEQMLYEGINVNITLLFSIERYQAVAERYVRALERRLEDGKTVDDVASVASFFLSRIDVLTDRLLGQRILPTSDGSKPRPESIMGKLAIASAKLAYQSFRQITSTDRWRALADEGARAQRLLWASTSTKNPLYDDVKYVEPLIGPETVNTMPSRTIDAFSDHGTVRPGTIEEEVDAARESIEAVTALGIDIEHVTRQLEHEGIRKFTEPFDTLMIALSRKRNEREASARQTIAPGAIESKLDASFGALDEIALGRRLFAKDPFLWTSDRERADAIRDRLGWLASPEAFQDRLAEIEDFAADVAGKFDRVLLLGMGGSSLAADMCAEIFGSASGSPELRVLDSTDPAEVASAETWADAGRTLYVVASKSGTTTETIAFYRYFYARLDQNGGPEPGARFVAITDPGSPLASEARDKSFLRVFENPPDIGGRYSALSYFGLVPMALVGIDVETMVARALDRLVGCGAALPAQDNPALALGATLGIAAREGRDKVTFVPGGRLDAFARWAEQLFAESTGKDGVGLVPVVDEPLGSDDAYGDDRIFVNLTTSGDAQGGPAARLLALEKSGHPVVRIELDDPIGIGGEIVRLEIATAVAGMMLGVNPFDEPNVAESKENTKSLLEESTSHSPSDELSELAHGDGFVVLADASLEWLQDFKRNQSPSAFFESFLSLIEPDDYLCLLPYLPRSAAVDDTIRRVRTAVRDRLRIATTSGYGPRYLHSTGQLHKGGPDRGIYVLLTADSEDGGPIPGESYDFGTLERAQALGDLRALHRRGRRAIRVHSSGNVDAALDELAAAATSRQLVARDARGAKTS